MKVDLSAEDLNLIDLLLAQEFGETKLEIHHSRNVNYKEYLKARLALIEDLQARLKKEPAANL
jgi:hypothetical protein